MTTKPETDREIANRVLRYAEFPLNGYAYPQYTKDLKALSLRLLSPTKRIEELEAVVNRPVGDIPKFYVRLNRDGSPYMQIHDEGEYVRYSDHLAAMRGREASAEAAKDLLTYGTAVMLGDKHVPHNDVFQEQRTMSKDIVLEALEEAVYQLGETNYYARPIIAAIAVQKQNAKVIKAVKTFREHGSGINGCYLNELGEELDALDALLSGEKV